MVEAETARSGGRLGGISTMVSQADVCPSCGGHHESRRRRFWDRSDRTEAGCPLVVHGPFPVLMRVPDPLDLDPDAPSELLRLPGMGELDGSPSLDESPSRRPGFLPAIWPRLPVDEGFS